VMAKNAMASKPTRTRPNKAFGPEPAVGADPLRPGGFLAELSSLMPAVREASDKGEPFGKKGEFWFRAAQEKVSAVDWEDSNVALVGSLEDMALRKAAAQTEPAWWGCGEKVGIQVWRIEKFEVVPWPEEDYGQFYTGDSYIVLQTFEEGPDKLGYRIFFWLGSETSIDEQGTAAYKTVELDDLFDGRCSQHREVQFYESDAFCGCFPKGVSYWEGGVESGFRAVCDVDLDAYVSRLLQVKKRGLNTVVVEVPCHRTSLNHGDAFILDTGSVLYTWFGSQSSSFERSFARMAAEELEAARAGRAVATGTADAKFWEVLGGQGHIKQPREASEVLPEPATLGEGVLYKLSDKTGQLYFSEVQRGALDVSMLLPDDVYICDPGAEVIVWVGEHASDRERRAAMLTATKYLALQGKPHTTPIKVFKSTQDAMSDSSFAQVFAGYTA